LQNRPTVAGFAASVASEPLGPDPAKFIGNRV
jgi:hypothetical protein